MPMFKALKLCPRGGRRSGPTWGNIADVGRPGARADAVGHAAGRAALHRRGVPRSPRHGAPPHGAPGRDAGAARTARSKPSIGITASIGLSYNKFLAKVASELDKPRGFAVIGRAEAETFLAAQPVRLIWGVGRQIRRAAQGRRHHPHRPAPGDRRTRTGRALRRHRLPPLPFRARRGRAHGRAGREAKSISAETTFDDDLGDFADLRRELWPLCERVAARLRHGDIAARTVVLKLKTAEFRIVTRRHRLPAPTQLAEVLYRAALPMLTGEADGRRFRLIGVGGVDLADARDADPADLLDPEGRRLAQLERVAGDRARPVGPDAIRKGRGLATRCRSGAMTRPASRLAQHGGFSALSSLSLPSTLKSPKSSAMDLDDAVFMCRRSCCSCSRLGRSVIVLEKSQWTGWKGRSTTAAEPTGRAGLGTQVLGDERTDIRNAVHVEAIEDRRPEEILAGLDMFQRCDGMGGREQRARRQPDSCGPPARCSRQRRPGPGHSGAPRPDIPPFTSPFSRLRMKKRYRRPSLDSHITSFQPRLTVSPD